ncbi:MAG: O-antigen ligase family protein [Bryobacteraceae bacterium]
MPAFILTALSLILGYAAFAGGGVWPADWFPCLLALGVTAAVYWVAVRRIDLAPPPGRLLRWLLAGIPLSIALQVVPLPVWLVRVLSPARVELQEAAAPVAGSSTWLTLSAAPAATAGLLLTALGCVVMFLLVRELAWRWEGSPWLPVAPLVVIAVLEAVLGLVQAYSAGGDGIARGTFVNRNHYAGLLEMCAPFPLAGGLRVLLRNRSRHSSPLRPALLACLLFATAALLLVAIVHSLSRMGFIAALFSLALIGVVTWSAGRHPAWRWLPIPALLAAALAGFILLPTDALIARFGDLAGVSELSADTRAAVWRDTGRLVAVYPLFGCGLGAYESVMARYNTAAPMNAVDFAHNDYLQLVAEGGVVCFLPLMAAVVIIVSTARRAAGRARVPASFVALGCLGSLTAILLHSGVDFSLHIPVNALIAAWVAGLAAAPE